MLMIHTKPIKTAIKQQVIKMAVDWENPEISTVWKLGYTALCLVVFGIFAAFSQPDRGVVAGFSTAAIVLAARLRWDVRNTTWFWGAIGTIALAHAVLVYVWGWSISVKPTILLAPLALADFIIIISAIFLVERVYGRGSNNG